MKSNHFPLVSIVILNYNGKNYLKKTLKPIFQINYPNYEVIIVDNGSSDGSVLFIKQRFPKAKLIELKNNPGYSYGKNKGAKVSSGKYILFLDNDLVLVQAISLFSLIKFEKDNGSCIIGLPFKDKGSNFIKYHGGFFYKTIEPLKEEKIIPTKKMLIGYPNGGAFFIERKLWFELGGFDESQPFNLDDKDIGIRTYLLGHKVILFNEVYFEHIGFGNRSDLNSWCWKHKYHFSGISRIIFKNFKILNLVRYFVIFFIFELLKTAKQSLQRGSIKPWIAFLFSVWIFIKNLPDTIHQRHIIQTSRKVKRDTFLEITSRQEI